MRLASEKGKAQHTHVYYFDDATKLWQCMGACGVSLRERPTGTVDKYGYIVVPTKVTLVEGVE